MRESKEGASAHFIAQAKSGVKKRMTAWIRAFVGLTVKTAASKAADLIYRIQA
jgi:hypothetical protein